MLQLPDKEQSLWRDYYAAPLYPKLDTEVEVDVAIIGAGMTGLTTAYMLKKRGYTVAVIDKASVAGGTSGRTTGKVSSQHGLIYADLLKRHGEKIARTYAAANQSAVEQIAAIIKTENIDCDWQPADNYIFTTEDRQLESLRAEATTALDLGLPASFELTAPLPFAIKGAVKFTGQAHFNSQKYLLGLAKIVNGDGSYIFEGSNVTGIKQGEVSTIHGKIIAKDIVVATNVPTLPLLARGSYCILEYPQESYIVAAKVPGLHQGMYISPDKQHYSILPLTVNGEPYVLIGGEGHLSGLRLSTTKKYQRLADYAENHFKATEITHMWSDRDYLSYDRLPHIGRLYPNSDHLYVATAYGKWGLSGSTVAATLLSDLIAGQDNPYDDIFEPNRLSAVKSIPRATGRYIKERLP